MPPLGSGKRPPPQTPMAKIFRGPALYLLLVLVLLWAFFALVGGTRDVHTLSLSEFSKLVHDGQVKDATIFDRDQRVEGELRDGTKYRVTYPTDYADDITN